MFLPFHLTTLYPALNKTPLLLPTLISNTHFQFSIPQADTAAHTKQHFKDDQTGCLHPLNPTCVSLPLHHNFSPASCSSSPAFQCPGPSCESSGSTCQSPSSACHSPSPVSQSTSPACPGPGAERSHRRHQNP
jgi:hypothetical protein